MTEEQNKCPSCKSTNIVFNSANIKGKFVSIGDCMVCGNKWDDLENCKSVEDKHLKNYQSYKITIDAENLTEKEFQKLYHQLSLKIESYGGTISFERRVPKAQRERL